MSKKFRIGDVVRHDFSLYEGTVTKVRDDKYSTYVCWDSYPERNDWYDTSVLVGVRYSGNAAVTLSDIKIVDPPESLRTSHDE